VVDGGGSTSRFDDAYLATMYDNMVPPATMGPSIAPGPELRIEALKRALKGIPPERFSLPRLLGVAGMGRTAPMFRWREIVDLILQVPRRRLRPWSRPTPATSTSGASGEDVKLPEDRVLLPGLVSHATKRARAP